MENNNEEELDFTGKAVIKLVKAKQLLKDALIALNEISNTKIRHEKYKNSYQVAADINEFLKNV